MRIDDIAELHQRGRRLDRRIADDLTVFHDQLAAQIAGGANIGRVIRLIDQGALERHDIAGNGGNLQSLAHQGRRGRRGADHVAGKGIIGNDLHPLANRNVGGKLGICDGCVALSIGAERDVLRLGLQAFRQHHGDGADLLQCGSVQIERNVTCGDIDDQPLADGNRFALGQDEGSAARQACKRVISASVAPEARRISCAKFPPKNLKAC